VFNSAALRSSSVCYTTPMPHLSYFITSLTRIPVTAYIHSW